MAVRLGAAAQHARLARPVDVRIQDARPRSFRVQGQGQVHGRRRFAHAALAGGDGDRVLDVVQGFDAPLHCVGPDIGADTDIDALHPRNLPQLPGDHIPQRVHISVRRVTHLQGNPDIVSVDLNILDHFSGDEVFFQVDVPHLCQRSFNCPTTCYRHATPVT